LGEHQLDKLGVTGSSPVPPTSQKPRYLPRGFCLGHARTVFRRALKHENLLVAEATAKEIGWISLGEALELTVLISRTA
jgi:hypothetical protein